MLINNLKKVSARGLYHSNENERKRKDRRDEYFDFEELKKLWNMKGILIPIEVCVLGKTLEKLGIR